MKNRISKMLASLMMFSLVVLNLQNSNYEYKNKIAILKEPVSGLLCILKIEKF